MKEGCERVYAEIDLDAVRSNIEYIKEKLLPGTGIMAVVKADGYGHGAVPIAKEIEDIGGVYGFAVATAGEAFQLRASGIKKPILILGYTFPGDYEQLIRQEIRMTAFREDTLEELSKACDRLGREGIRKKAKVHIKVDTGMSRIGVCPNEEGLSFVEKVFAARGVEAEGIFTHFARADEKDKTNVKEQISSFKNFLSIIKEKTGKEIPLKHCSNSAGILELPEANMDMVRAGIILYGLWPSEQIKREGVKLMPALSLYSRLVSVREIEAGTAVSYGGTFTAERKTRVGTVPAGYADGYARGLSNRGYVLIRGRRAPVLGRVCMDQFMVDVTDIPQVLPGDRVTLLGKDGGERITMEELGDLSGRFNYEFACCIGSRVPRVYVKGGGKA